MKRIIAGLWLLLPVTFSFAQDENARNIIGKNKGYDMFYGGIETSTVSYIDTKTADSSGTAIYLAAYLDYSHKSGLGLMAKSYMLPGGSNPGFYLSSISPYFARYEGKVFPYISYTRYIQHSNPAVPYSPMQNEVYAHLRVKTKFIDPMAGIDWGFGRDEQNNNASVNDVNAFLAVTHLFLKEGLGQNGNNAFAIRPGLQLNAGTDRYYKFFRTSGYISKNTSAGRLGYGRRMGNGNQGGGATTGSDMYIISETNDFSLSNLAANIYVMYFLGRFSIEPSGSLYFPLRGEDKSAYGFWQVNVNYWIK